MVKSPIFFIMGGEGDFLFAKSGGFWYNLVVQVYSYANLGKCIKTVQCRVSRRKVGAKNIFYERMRKF